MKKYVFMELQLACNNDINIPKKRKFKIILNEISNLFNKSLEITLRIVNIKEMIELNKKYCKIQKPTNSLSFNINIYNLNIPLVFGDIVICKDIIEQESKIWNKPLELHWIHIFIHGSLHLLGYNHKNKLESKVMETLEIKIMKKFSYSNPYYL